MHLRRNMHCPPSCQRVGASPEASCESLARRNAPNVLESNRLRCSISIAWRPPERPPASMNFQWSCEGRCLPITAQYGMCSEFQSAHQPQIFLASLASRLANWRFSAPRLANHHRSSAEADHPNPPRPPLPIMGTQQHRQQISTMMKASWTSRSHRCMMTHRRGP
jgi:hypothetical protein